MGSSASVQQQAQEEVQTLQVRLKEQQLEAAAKDQVIEDLEAQIAALQQEASVSRAQVQEANQQIQELHRELETTRHHLHNAEGMLSRSTDVLSKVVQEDPLDMDADGSADNHDLDLVGLPEEHRTAVQTLRRQKSSLSKLEPELRVTKEQANQLLRVNQAQQLQLLDQQKHILTVENRNERLATEKQQKKEPHLIKRRPSGSTIVHAL
eukprot:m.83931 g.83931  ORF g.83931 m.83931 type:complete len:209 (+) comp14780_c0_seq1:462-1088(+)